MLYPQTNTHRQAIDLSGFWSFRFDSHDMGVSSNWQNGFNETRPITVPASWNDQFEEGRDFLGPAWYQTAFDIPWGWDGRRIVLRFGSVNYHAKVWVNGHAVGGHEGGHLPFEFDITSLIKNVGNLLTVRVDGRLAFDTVPPGNVTGAPEDFFPSHAGNYPQGQFDFFPYCGIHRQVWLCATSKDHIQDVTVQTDLEESQGHVRVLAQMAGNAGGKAIFHLTGHGYSSTKEAETLGNSAAVDFKVEDVAPWSTTNPNLYDLKVEFLDENKIIDTYSLKVGIRTVQIVNGQFLLNGEPVYLTGFGRHEDFPVIGRGYMPAAVVKDYALMQWMGANSFRTSHYPYSEQMLDLADQLGFLVIDETPAVGLYFREDGLAKRNELCEQYLREMIARDKNHPSVIMWSMANEPHSTVPHARPLFEKLYQQAKALDSTRPVTLVSFLGGGEEAFAFCDLVCLNRYVGWYVQGGDLDQSLTMLSAELDALYEKFKKPILLAEFGADAIPGHHAQPPEMFSEEYQADLIVRYMELLREKPYVIGEHVWNMCDFKTSQGITRAGALNYKGVFTRDRRPKLAAHRIREIWRKLQASSLKMEKLF